MTTVAPSNSPFLLTIKKFPSKASVKLKSGIIWGALVQPLRNRSLTFKSIAGEEAQDIPAAEIARCSSCHGFINPYCMLQFKWWQCNLCQQVNPFLKNTRYDYQDQNIHRLPEVQFPNIEYKLSCNSQGVENNPMVSSSISFREYYIFILDETGTGIFDQLLYSTIESALKAFSDDAWIGFFTISDRIGMWNVCTTPPQIRFISFEEMTTFISFQEIPYTLEDWMIPLGEYRSTLFDSFEKIHRMHYQQQQPHSSFNQRAIGPMLKWIYNLVIESNARNKEMYMTFTNCILYLQGIPNLGSGQLKEDRWKSKCSKEELLQSACSFYKDIGLASSENHLMYDLIIVSNGNYMDIASLRPLVTTTGGRIFYCTTHDSSILAQDVYVYYHQPVVYDCLLRVRTSTEFHFHSSILSAHWNPHPCNPHLFHRAKCHPQDMLALEFQFHSHFDHMASLQMSFAYSILQNFNFMENKTSSHRYLRVFTQQIPTKEDPQEVIQSMNPENAFIWLLHKVIFSLQQSHISFNEIKSFIRNWLIEFLCQYHFYILPSKKEKGSYHVPQLDDFIHLIHGILNSKLLKQFQLHPDVHIGFQEMFKCTSPQHLRLIFHPILIGFESIEVMQIFPLSLSQSAMKKTKCPIFILNNGYRIYVYYTKIAITEQQIPFPPPSTCLLQLKVQEWKDQQSAHVLWIKEGSFEARYLNVLMDDEDMNIEDDESSFYSFQQEVLFSVRQRILH